MAEVRVFVYLDCSVVGLKTALYQMEVQFEDFGCRFEIQLWVIQADVNP